jgi:hypothetical protein
MIESDFQELPKTILSLGKTFRVALYNFPQSFGPFPPDRDGVTESGL